MALDPRWERDLAERTGSRVLPVVVIGEETVVGFDRERIVALLGLSDHNPYDPEWEGLELGSVSELGLKGAPKDLVIRIKKLLAGMQRELEYNADKGLSPYRFGQHDGLRFARDALIRLMAGADDPADTGQPLREGAGTDEAQDQPGR